MRALWQYPGGLCVGLRRPRNPVAMTRGVELLGLKNLRGAGAQGRYSRAGDPGPGAVLGSGRQPLGACVPGRASSRVAVRLRHCAERRQLVDL